MSSITESLKALRHKRAILWDKYVNIWKFTTTDFCLISNNCWASMHFYQRFGIKYNIPTVGLYISDNDFIKFCNNIKYYLNQPLKFIKPESSPAFHEVTRWGKELNRHEKIKFPVGMIADVTLWFMHYQSKEEALQKWYRRRERVTIDKIIVKWSQRYTDDDNVVRDFINLPYRKFGFVDESCQIDSPSLIKINGWNELRNLGGDEISYLGKKVETIAIINNAINQKNN